MKKENVIQSCYSLLRKSTPLDFDCGKICKGKCCAGDERTGMLLFPGEENLIDPDIKVVENAQGDKIAVCNGICDRNKRPLSCRIYPLFPLILEKNGKEVVSVIFDLRADCPLSHRKYRFNRDFVKSVKRTGKFLLLNEETGEFYRGLSAMQEEFLDFSLRLE